MQAPTLAAKALYFFALPRPIFQVSASYTHTRNENNPGNSSAFVRLLIKTPIRHYRLRALIPISEAMHAADCVCGWGTLPFRHKIDACSHMSLRVAGPAPPDLLPGGIVEVQSCIKSSQKFDGI